MKFFAIAIKADGTRVTLGWSRSAEGAQKRINWSVVVPKAGASEAKNMGYVSFTIEQGS
jgi:hypothetical protein